MNQGLKAKRKAKRYDVLKVMRRLRGPQTITVERMRDELRRYGVEIIASNSEDALRTRMYKDPAIKKVAPNKFRRNPQTFEKFYQKAKRLARV